MLRLDLHVHTIYSGDAYCSVTDLIKTARKKGLNGVAITDHDCTTGNEVATKINPRDFLFIPGIEVSSLDGHILGLGIDEPIKRDLHTAQTVDLIREKGGIAVAPHPFKLGLKPFVALKSEFDAVEVFNSRNHLGNSLAHRFAERNRLPITAGSDAHFPDEIGLAGVMLNCEPSVEDVLKTIKEGKGTSVFGQTLPLSDYLRKALQKLSNRIRCMVSPTRGGPSFLALPAHSTRYRGGGFHGGDLSHLNSELSLIWK